ncbi:MAG: methylmalonyl-CoA mutase family protein [Planctomycetota bacterium]
MQHPKTSWLEDFPAVSYDQWRQTVERDLAGVPFEKKLVTHTYEGIDLQPIYTADDWPCDGDPSGFPGFAPTTRGVTPLGGSSCGWDIRQEHAHPDLAASNQAILDDLAGGVTSLQLRLDAAARIGLDADHPAAAELAARDGLTVNHTDDWDVLLDGVFLDIAGLALEAGAAAIPAAAQLVALLRRRHVPLDKARGSLNADPLAVLARRGEYPVPIDAAMRQLGDLAVWTDHNLPKFTAVRVGIAPYHHAGATASQDLAFSMATAVVYLRALTGAGLSPDAAARQLMFSFGVGTNLFLAVAKLRAARRLWAQVAAHCGVSDDLARTGMTMHVRTSKRVLTHRDPYVNMLRGTVCTFAAAAGGAQIITCEPFDKALGLPDAFSRRIARNTQAILAEESHLAQVVDPAGGSWMVESLTDQLCDKAWPIFQDVERQGGMAEALTSGWVSDQIESAFAPRSKNIARRKDAVTGVSEFPNLAEQSVEARKADRPSIIHTAHERLRHQRHERHPDAQSALDSLAATAAVATDPGMITAHAVAAAETGATLGQLADAVFGDRDGVFIAPIAPHAYAEPFENLRDASDRFLALTGERPRIMLINLGPVAHHTARATYAQNFFEAGGIEPLPTPPITGDLNDMANEAAERFWESQTSMACLCSSDKLYPDTVPDVARALKAAGCDQLVLAGAPGDHETAYRDAGVDRFIFMKCDVLHTLTDMLEHAGVLHPQAAVNA